MSMANSEKDISNAEIRLAMVDKKYSSAIAFFEDYFSFIEDEDTRIKIVVEFFIQLQKSDRLCKESCMYEVSLWDYFENYSRVEFFDWFMDTDRDELANSEVKDVAFMGDVGRMLVEAIVKILDVESLYKRAEKLLNQEYEIERIVEQTYYSVRTGIVLDSKIVETDKNYSFKLVIKKRFSSRDYGAVALTIVGKDGEEIISDFLFEPDENLFTDLLKTPLKDLNIKFLTKLAWGKLISRVRELVLKFSEELGWSEEKLKERTEVGGEAISDMMVEFYLEWFVIEEK